MGTAFLLAVWPIIALALLALGYWRGYKLGFLCGETKGLEGELQARREHLRDVAKASADLTELSQMFDRRHSDAQAD